MFKKGDKVQYKQGHYLQVFSNGDRIVTVERVDKKNDENQIRLQETGTWVDEHCIELVYIPSAIDEVKLKVQKLIDYKQEQIKNLEDDIKKLNYTIVTLGELND